MPYDYTRKALYKPETKHVFEGMRPDLIFDASEQGYSLTNCWWLSNLAHLAYFDEEPLRAELEKVHLELVDFYNAGGTQGFLAKTSEFAVLAFRGTEPDEFRDSLQDIKIPMVPFGDIGNVHKGFRDALDFVWPQVESGLQRLEVSGIPVWITGHSLGAALATLAAARRAPAALFTFGSPRVGDREFQKLFSSMNTHRAVNCADIVTTVPPGNIGYQHVGDLYFLTEAAPLVKNPSKSTMRSAKTRAILRYTSRLPWLRKDWVTARSLTDHAIINYSAGLWKEMA